MPRSAPRLSLVLILLTLVAGCSRGRDSGRPSRSVPAAPDAVTRAVASGINAMGFDLYAAARSEPGNLVFSPASIGFALGMVYGGAAGDTATDLARVMHLDAAALAGPPDAVHRGFAGLLARASEYGDGARLRIANRIWAQEGRGFARAFLALTRDYYGAEAENAAFAREAEAVRARINAWVAGVTNDRIRDLLPAGSVGGDTVMVLVNAIWFKGQWKRQFDKAHTADAPFTLEGGGVVQVKTMGQLGKARLAAIDDVRLLELDYQGSDLSMVLVLGDRPGGLAELESRLTAANLSSWLAALREVDELHVAVPRFEVTQLLPLKALLLELGLTRLFADADLSPMLESGEKGLFVSDAVHKAFVTVNEEGAEAAAATAIVVTEAAAAQEPPSFHADRPFVWFIRDRQTGLVLFLGRVVDPR